jgi:hypothetical protein
MRTTLHLSLLFIVLIIFSCVQSLKEPQNEKSRFELLSKRGIAASLALGIAVNTFNPNRVPANEEDLYIDEVNHFRVSIFPGWKVTSKPPDSAQRAVFSLNPKSAMFKSQEILFSASNFAEGTSMTVVKTDARQMLKDANVEWWFGPLDTLREVGTPLLISELLIRDRFSQLKDSNPYEFGSTDRAKRSFNDYQNADLKEFDIQESLSNETEQSVSFSYVSEIAPLVKSKTLGKAYYRQGKLFVLLVSSLSNVQESEYGAVLKDIVNSYSYTL